MQYVKRSFLCDSFLSTSLSFEWKRLEAKIEAILSRQQQKPLAFQARSLYVNVKLLIEFMKITILVHETEKPQ